MFQKFEDFVRDYFDRKDISTINLGSGIAQEEFEKLLKAKVEAVFKKLWGFQIEKITYDRVRDAMDLGKLPEGFIDPLNTGVDDWIQNEWNPTYKEAITLAAQGTNQITGMVGKIASATGVGVIFNPDTQRMLNIIDTEGLNLAVQLKKQQVMSLRTTLRRSIKENWTRKRTHDEMKADVSLTDRENIALERFTQRQRNEIYKEFKKKFPGLTEKELNKRVEAVVARRRKVKYEKYRNGRSERFYRTELSRARNEGNLEGMQQAVNQGAIKNAKKKWVRTNEIDSWESSDRFNGKIIPFDGDFWKLFGKPKKTTMLNGKYPGEINELCIVQYFAEKGDGKPVAVEAVAPFVPAKTIKEAEDYAVKTLKFKASNYKGMDLRFANNANERFYKFFNKYPEFKGEFEFTGSIGNLATHLKKIGWNRTAQRISVRAKGRNTWGVYNPSPNSFGFMSDAIVNDWDGYVKSAKDAIKNNWHPLVDLEDSFSSTVDHEIGHFIFKKLFLRRNEKINAIFKKLKRKQIARYLSGYAGTDIAEFVAEAWSEYTVSKSPRPLSKQVGDIITGLLEKKNG